MKAVLSIQSHVTYGFVGNKAATYPLQSLGFDVWPVNTVHFSNHTGYGKWKGNIHTKQEIKEIIDGIFDINVQNECVAIISGYMGSQEICHAVKEVVDRFKSVNKDLLYLCDPVIGNNNCFVKPEVLDYFKNHLSADIITPNQYEAEVLSSIKIRNEEDLKKVANFFHNKSIKIVVITGMEFENDEGYYVFASNIDDQYLFNARKFDLKKPINGTGDLFSSVFLGFHLKNDPLYMSVIAAKDATEKALENSIKKNMKELDVLSVDYKNL